MPLRCKIEENHSGAEGVYFLDVSTSIHFSTREKSFRRNLRRGGLRARVDVVDVGGRRGARAPILPRWSVYARFDVGRRDAQPIPGSLGRLLLRSGIERSEQLVETSPFQQRNLGLTRAPNYNLKYLEWVFAGKITVTQYST